MYKMLKVSEETHKIAKVQAAYNEMSLMDYLEHIIKCEYYEAQELESFLKTKDGKKIMKHIKEVNDKENML